MYTQKQKEQLAQQTMQLDECIQLNEDTIQRQQHTMMMLKEQQQTINNIDRKLDVVDSNVEKSNVIVDKMNSTWSFIKGVFSSKDDKDEQEAKKKATLAPAQPVEKLPDFDGQNNARQ